jgi:hypothetical protein
MAGPASQHAVVRKVEGDEINQSRELRRVVDLDSSANDYGLLTTGYTNYGRRTSSMETKQPGGDRSFV